MFAAHELLTGVPQRKDWAAHQSHGQTLRRASGQQLVEALGFTVESHGRTTAVLRLREGQARGIAVFLDRTETPESAAGRFEISPVSDALAIADRENLPFVVLTRGSEIRLYAASQHQGVGRKGRAETYVAADLKLISDERIGLVPLIFGAAALADGGTFEQLLEESRDFAHDLSGRLRDRVYEEVVPRLALAIARQHAARDDEAPDLDFVYEQTLVLLFRLLFIAYAEDRELLPYRGNELYRAAALKTTARQLATLANGGGSFAGATTTSLWSDLIKLFDAIDQGNGAWSVPAYNGGLFTADVRSIRQRRGADSHQSHRRATRSGAVSTAQRVRRQRSRGRSRLSHTLGARLRHDL